MKNTKTLLNGTQHKYELLCACVCDKWHTNGSGIQWREIGVERGPLVNGV